MDGMVIQGLSVGLPLAIGAICVVYNQGKLSKSVEIQNKKLDDLTEKTEESFASLHETSSECLERISRVEGRLNGMRS